MRSTLKSVLWLIVSLAVWYVFVFIPLNTISVPIPNTPRRMIVVFSPHIPGYRIGLYLLGLAVAIAIPFLTRARKRDVQVFVDDTDAWPPPPSNVPQQTVEAKRRAQQEKDE